MSPVLLLSVFVGFRWPIALSVFSPAAPGDRCVMRGRHEGDFGGAPYAYAGPPLRLDSDEAHLLADNETALQLLRDTCPEFDGGSSSVPLLCCSAGQLRDLREHMEIVSSVGMSRCPACFHNFRRFACAFSCSPRQRRFLTVLRTRTDEGSGREAVLEVRCHMSERLAHDFFHSCWGLKGFIPGTHLFDYGFCGPWGHTRCSPERWLDYMGLTPDEGGHSPLLVRHRFSAHRSLLDERGAVVWPLRFPTAR